MSFRRVAASVTVFGVVPVLAALLHHRYGLGYPLPQDDESRFLIPAWELAEHGTLKAPPLNAPDGIFWVLHGMYVIQGALAWAFSPWSLERARWASFVGVQLFYFGIVAIAWRRPSNWARYSIAGVAAAFALSSVALRAGNEARMEALVLGLFGLACIAIAAKWYLASLAAVLVACTVHPVAFAPAAGMIVALIVFRNEYRRSTTQWVLVTGAVVIIALQAGYALAHLDLVRDHFSTQLNHRDGTPMSSSRLIAGAGAVAAAIVAVLALRCEKIFSWPRETALAAILVCAMGGGIAAYVFVTGYEWAYAVYAFGAVPALLVTAFVMTLDAPSAVRADARLSETNVAEVHAS